MTYQLTRSFQYFTNLPQDVITNTWHFNWVGGGSPALGNFQALEAVVQQFDLDIYDSTFGIAPYVDMSKTNVKIYNLATAPPRAPVYNHTYAAGLTQKTATTTPLEASTVLSMKATYQTGIPPARQRGRIYIGGLTDFTIDPASSSAFPTVAATWKTNVLAAATYMLAHMASSWQWVVYSPTGAASYAVTGGWMDNAIDTQRRRGTIATVRTNWP